MERPAAGKRALALLFAMARDGETPVSLLTAGQTPEAYHHYPPGDVYDFASHSQFYFHAHRDGEAGHLHVFVRPRGMPPGLVPLVPTDSPDAPCHLIAIGFDGGDEAVELFTTNRWVTGEAWYPAAAVKAMVAGFRISARGRLQPVAAWLEAMIAFYAPTIEDLLDRRDATVAEWRQSHALGDPLDDGGLEITSRCAIDLAADAAR
ncbi:conserved hypothetical protein [Candidatus Terasakiella magnetica]|nr:conserved hypothetical protein [Candidatus Terasakiella magnetica]